MSSFINVGIVGLGRLGKEYAYNLRHKISNAQLIAACSLSAEERAYARTTLLIPNVLESYDDMLQLEAIDAVFVVSSTDMHADHMVKALQAGKHVFSEKPLAITVEECKRVKAIAENYPELLATVGFVRRHDSSYRYAKKKADEGAIGTPFLIKSQTVDKDSVSDFQIKYATRSGGIFHDYNVHDIDLTRWFLNSEFKTVKSIGGAYKYKAFAEIGDADNVMTSCQLDNGAMALISASRTAAHGHDTYTEITGTEGTLRIGRPGAINRVEIYDVHGARRECVSTFWERFEYAFLDMATDFINCIVDGRRPELTIDDAIYATQVAEAFTQSYRSNRSIKVSY